MKTRIIQIGNSKGVRIPKRLLEQAGLHGEVEMCVEHDTLVIGPAGRPRAGWAAAFREMSRHGEDSLLDAALPSLSSWDDDEWDWD
jgi:antitoxin MazE